MPCRNCGSETPGYTFPGYRVDSEQEACHDIRSGRCKSGEYKSTKLTLYITTMWVVFKNERWKTSLFGNEKFIPELAGLVGISYSTDSLF